MIQAPSQHLHRSKGLPASVLHTLIFYSNTSSILSVSTHTASPPLSFSLSFRAPQPMAPLSLFRPTPPSSYRILPLISSLLCIYTPALLCVPPSGFRPQDPEPRNHTDCSTSACPFHTSPPPNQGLPHAFGCRSIGAAQRTGSEISPKASLPRSFSASSRSSNPSIPSPQTSCNAPSPIQKPLPSHHHTLTPRPMTSRGGRTGGGGVGK